MVHNTLEKLCDVIWWGKEELETLFFAENQREKTTCIFQAYNAMIAEEIVSSGMSKALHIIIKYYFSVDLLRYINW